MIVEGRILQMIVMIVLVALSYWSISSIKKGMNISLRPLPALEAIDEAVGRAVEMGRPVHFTPGFCKGSLMDARRGPGTIAALTILKPVAESCAERGARLIVTISPPEAIPIAEETVKNAYDTKNIEVPPDTVRFISAEQNPYCSGVLSILKEERPGANFLMGSFSSEFLQFAATGVSLGAMQIAGTPTVYQIPFMVTTCDYGLMGEELYAAMAYIDKDASHLGSLLISDFFRVAIIVIIILAFLGGNLKLSWLLNILEM